MTIALKQKNMAMEIQFLELSISKIDILCHFLATKIFETFYSLFYVFRKFYKHVIGAISYKN